MNILLNSKPFHQNLGLLILRLGAGGLMFTHGWSKLAGYQEKVSSFGDPIGLGSEVSFTLVVFAEAICAALVIMGLFTRLALIPLIINMIVIVFIVHGNDFGKQEFGLLYLVPYLTLFCTGPGKYSLDVQVRKT